MPRLENSIGLSRIHLNEFLRFHSIRCTVKNQPTSTMVDVLIPIWQRVLQLSSLGIEDNFFNIFGWERIGSVVIPDVLLRALACSCGRLRSAIMAFWSPWFVMKSIASWRIANAWSSLYPRKPGNREPVLSVCHAVPPEADTEAARTGGRCIPNSLQSSVFICSFRRSLRPSAVSSARHPELLYCQWLY